MFVRAESKAQVLGPSEVYVKQGSTLSLNCVVSNAEESVAVFWYRDLNVIDEGRHDSVATDVHYDAANKVMTSHLRVANIPLTSAGNYTCLPSATESASVVVHVINGTCIHLFFPLFSLSVRLSVRLCVPRAPCSARHCYHNARRTNGERNVAAGANERRPRASLGDLSLMTGRTSIPGPLSR